MSEQVPIDREAGLRMYAGFLRAHPEVAAQDDVEVVCFGDGPDLADELTQFAWDEGECDRTLATWWMATGACLRRQCARSASSSPGSWGCCLSGSSWSGHRDLAD